VHNFCTVDLSAFYLDIIKDRLYTFKADSAGRRAAQTTIHHVLEHLVRLLAPVLVFTTDEAWGFMPGKRVKSVHLSEMPEPNKEWLDEGLEKKWETILKVKNEASKVLEDARKKKLIGHSLDAKVIISPTAELKGLLEKEAGVLKEILIVSQLEVVDRAPEGAQEALNIPGLKISVTKAEGEKCERCWNISTSVGENEEHKTICERCIRALS
jgi:isoleucyl-tRNA synthetase